MNAGYATAMHNHMADIATQLARAVALAESKADPEDLPGIRRSLGILLGLAEELLWPIYRAYPELDPIGTPIPPAESLE